MVLLVRYPGSTKGQIFRTVFFMQEAEKKRKSEDKEVN